MKLQNKSLLFLKMCLDSHTLLQTVHFILLNYIFYPSCILIANSDGELYIRLQAKWTQPQNKVVVAAHFGGMCDRST